jgi:hypothetical protein
MSLEKRVVSPFVCGRRLLAILLTVVIALVQAPILVSATSSGPSPYRALGTLNSQRTEIQSGEHQGSLPASLQSQLSGLSTSMYFKNCTVMSGPHICQYGDIHGSQTLVIMGDSLAMQWIPALSSLGTKYHFKVVGFMLGGCNIASAEVVSLAFKKLEPACTAFRRAAIAAVNQLNPQPSLVILGESRYLTWPNGDQVTKAQWGSAIAKTLHSIRSNQKVVIYGDPEWRMSPSTCVALHASNVSKCSLSLKKILSPASDGFSSIVAAGAYPLGTTVLLCDAQCPVTTSDDFTHADQWHLTASYSRESAPALGTLLGCGFYSVLSDRIAKELAGTLSSAKRTACRHYLSSRGSPR